MPSQRSKTRLLLADHAPTRLGIRIALGDEIHVCGEAGSAEEAIIVAERERPDICLVGVDLPGGTIAAVQGICSAVPDTAVVVLASAPDVDDMIASVRAGAIGYIPASVKAGSLRRVVAAVASGEAAMPRSMVLGLARELRGTAAGRADGLTPREAQVLNMLRRGQSTSAIANRLAISPVTVRRHISTLVHKVGVEGRSALAGTSRRDGPRAGDGENVPDSVRVHS
jgi:DNA-binding NarL/FixJ family response regulator